MKKKRFAVWISAPESECARLTATIERLRAKMERELGVYVSAASCVRKIIEDRARQDQERPDAQA